MSATGVDRWLTASPLAERLGCDVRHLARLVAKGVLTCRPSKRGREYPWPDSRDAYLRYQIAEAVGSVAGHAPDRPDPDLELALLRRSQRAEVDLRLAEKQKQLVPQVWLLETQEALLARLAGVVDAWPNAWQDALIGLDADGAARVAAAQRAQLRTAFFEVVGDAEGDATDSDAEDGDPPPQQRAA